jgi:hypothetical protein
MSTQRAEKQTKTAAAAAPALTLTSDAPAAETAAAAAPAPARTGGPGTSVLGAALLKAQGAIQNVAKGSENVYHKYAYTSADDMVAAAREALHSGGLTVHVERHELLADLVPEMVVVRTTFALMHQSGESRSYVFELPAIADKGRPLDKAILGAKTTSLAYFLRDLLQIPRVDENEVDRRDDRDHVPAPQAPRTQPASLGAEDAAGLAAAMEDRGLTVEDLRNHLRSLRVSGGSVEAEPASWPRTWKPSIREWLSQHPASAKADGKKTAATPAASSRPAA